MASVAPVSTSGAGARDDQAGPTSGIVRVIVYRRTRRWLLIETAKWRTRDARVVVTTLRKEGLVTTEPSGRITATGRVSLRN